MSKSFAQYCERNKQPILDQLSIYFRSSSHVLEIGSGTGQHAVFFAENLSHLTWQPSDLKDNHRSIAAWVTESQLANVMLPIEFVVGRDPWPDRPIDAVFSANTAHIMQPHETRQMMTAITDNLPEGGVFCQYGPMIVDGDYTSESNRSFDQSLKSQGFGGIRSIEELSTWAGGMELQEMIPMPANNLLLVWGKGKVESTS